MSPLVRLVKTLKRDGLRLRELRTRPEAAPRIHARISAVVSRFPGCAGVSSQSDCGCPVLAAAAPQRPTVPDYGWGHAHRCSAAESGALNLDFLLLTWRQSGFPGGAAGWDPPTSAAPDQLFGWIAGRCSSPTGTRLRCGEANSTQPSARTLRRGKAPQGRR